MYSRITLVGRLTREPELRNTSSGKSVASFDVAVDEGWGDNKKTQYWKCEAWDKTADFVSNYLTKGSKVFVDGAAKLNEYTTKDGVERKEIKVSAGTVLSLDGKKDGDGGSAPRQPAEKREQKSQGGKPATSPDNVVEGGGGDDGASDLPF